MKMYRAENLKYRHSFTGILWFLMQLLTLALAYGISRGNGISSAYNWWYTLMLPGMLPTMIVNIILNGSGTFMAVTTLWMMNPWAVMPRLMTVVIGILPNGLRAVPESMTYIPGITDPKTILPGVLVTCAWLVIFWGMSRYWYEKKGVQTV